MGIPQTQTFDVTQYRLDLASYQYWFNRTFGAPDEDFSDLRNLLYKAIQYELSDVQRTYLCMYYFEGLTMEEIASQNHVNKSTISRTIKRARARLFRCLKYSSPKMLLLFEKGDVQYKIKHNKGGEILDGMGRESDAQTVAE